MSATDTPGTGGTITPAAKAAPAQADLARVVARMAGPVFAVVDGGHFNDLPAALSDTGLAARSLFLGHGEREAERSGPWFVPVGAAEDAAKVLGLVGDLPAVVFWSCATGDVALYGHLRRLNMARLPMWAAAGKEGPEPGVEADQGWEAVLFRHWDPSVLGALLPVLDEGQFSRILGPAQEVAFFAANYGATKRVVADLDWPLASAGMLVIRPEQVEALTERRLAASKQRMVAYLRRVAPEHVRHLTDSELMVLAGQHQKEAHGLGVRADRETFMWSFMRLTSVGDISRDPGIMRFMAEPKFGSNPEARLRQLYALRLELLCRDH